MFINKKMKTKRKLVALIFIYLAIFSVLSASMAPVYAKKKSSSYTYGTPQVKGASSTKAIKNTFTAKNYKPGSVQGMGSTGNGKQQGTSLTTALKGALKKNEKNVASKNKKDAQRSKNATQKYSGMVGDAKANNDAKAAADAGTNEDNSSAPSTSGMADNTETAGSSDKDNKDGKGNIFTWLVTELLSLLCKLILGCLDMLYEIFQWLFFPDYDMGKINVYNGGTSIASLTDNTSSAYQGQNLGISGHTTSTFFDVFGNIGGFFAVFQKIGLIFAIIIFFWQAFRSLYGPITGGENPYTLGARMAITIAMIYGAQFFLSMLVSILRIPYALIFQQTQANKLNGKTTGIFTNANDKLNKSLSDADVKSTQKEDASNLHDTVSSGSGDEGTVGSSLVCTLLSFGMILLVGKQFLIVILESVERYVLTGVLYIVAPLAMATNVSENTKNIFHSWMQMFISSGLLIGLNVFFVSVAGYGLSTMSNNNKLIGSDTKSVISEFVGLAMVYGFLRVASHFDDYLGALGISTTKTGMGIGADLLGATAATLGLPIGAAKGGMSILRDHDYLKHRSHPKNDPNKGDNLADSQNGNPINNGSPIDTSGAKGNNPSKGNNGKGNGNGNGNGKGSGTGNQNGNQGQNGDNSEGTASEKTTPYHNPGYHSINPKSSSQESEGNKEDTPHDDTSDSQTINGTDNTSLAENPTPSQTGDTSSSGDAAQTTAEAPQNVAEPPEGQGSSSEAPETGSNTTVIQGGGGGTMPETGSSTTVTQSGGGTGVSGSNGNAGSGPSASPSTAGSTGNPQTNGSSSPENHLTGGTKNQTFGGGGKGFNKKQNNDNHNNRNYNNQL